MPVNPLNVRQDFLTTDAVRLEVGAVLPNDDGLINLALNPSGINGPWWWWTDAPSTIVQASGGLSAPGVAVYQTGTTTGCYVRTGTIRVDPGEVVQGRWDLVDVTATLNVKARYNFWDADRAFISNTAFSGPVSSAGTTYIDAATAPAGTRYVTVTFRLYSGTSTNPSGIGNHFTMRRVMVAKSLPPDVATQPFDYVEPYVWQNILDGATELRVHRETLNVSPLTVLSVDPTLDPGTTDSDLLAAGRPIRVTTDVGAGVFEPVYTGTIRAVRTSYVNDKDAGTSKPRITIAATDGLTELANQPAAKGFFNLDGLANNFGANALESDVGAGIAVPWDFDGVSRFGYDLEADPDSVNSNASLLDQVALTRDSLSMGLTTGGPGGLAWVSRYGVLTMVSTPSTTSALTYSNDTLPSATVDSYSDIEIDYATDSVINSVSVAYLRAVSGADSQSVPYGPYQDQGSIDENSRFATTLTLTGPVEATARIRGCARALLASNADPTRSVLSILVPVLSTYGRAHAARVELGDVVTIDAAEDLTVLARVSSIDHQITPGGWLVKYGFEPNGRAPVPQRIPTPAT